MRRVLAATFVSLDGVMQAPGAPEEDPTGGFTLGGWTFPYFDDSAGKVMGDIFGHPFDLLLGRKTYDIFAAYWPYQQPDDSIAKAFNACTKYVATRSDKPLTWEKSVRVKDAASELAKLKQGEGPDLLIQGSSDLIQTLLANRLIDQLKVLVFPLLLGRGKRLFGAGTIPGALKLVDNTVLTTGVVVSTYVPAGEVVPGSFATQEPSPAELERRRTWS